MKSLNTPYDFDTFHEQLVVLASVAPSSHVLDVGCGVGRTLRCAARVAERVVGIDRSEEALGSARESLGDAVEAGRVVLQKFDVDQQKLPYQDTSFDNVICQNVLECITDKLALIGECGRVLKPGGVFLLGHHDYGCVMVNSADRGLTREIIEAYADETQDWMPSSDGEVGRKLPGLVSSANFGQATTETRQLVDLSFGLGTYAREYCEQASESAVRAGLRQEQVDKWKVALAELDKHGQFYFSIPWIYVRVTKG